MCDTVTLQGSMQPKNVFQFWNLEQGHVMKKHTCIRYFFINWVGMLKIWAWKILSYCANNPWELEILETPLLGELVGCYFQLVFMEGFTLCSIGFHSVCILIFCSQQPYITQLLTWEDGTWNPIWKNLSNFHESN